MFDKLEKSEMAEAFARLGRMPEAAALRQHLVETLLDVSGNSQPGALLEEVGRRRFAQHLLNQLDRDLTHDRTDAAALVRKPSAGVRTASRLGERRVPTEPPDGFGEPAASTGRRRVTRARRSPGAA
jgi:hypothetical protein